VPLASLKHLTSIEPIAKALVALPSFLPDLAVNTGGFAGAIGGVACLLHSLLHCC
jgi:hypothetical protein